MRWCPSQGRCFTAEAGFIITRYCRKVQLVQCGGNHFFYAISLFARAKRRRCKATPPVRCLFVCLEVGPASPTPEVFNRGLYWATKASASEQTGAGKSQLQQRRALSRSPLQIGGLGCFSQCFCLTFSVSLTLWTLPNFLVSQPLRKGPPRGRSAREFSVSTCR